MQRRPLTVPLAVSLPLAAIVTFLAAPAPAPAQAPDTAEAPYPSNRWTPELSIRYRTISATAMSPDGERVAYVVRWPLLDDTLSRYTSQIWVTDADGSAEARQYTRGAASAGSPSFSPDGRWLAYVSSPPDGESQVWVVPLAGGAAFPVTAAEEGVGDYAWSPDGSRIAFTTREPKPDAEVEREKEKRDVTIVGEEYRLAQLWVAPFEPDAVEPPEPTRLTSGERHVSSFAWSPDGRTLVFAHQPDPAINTGFTTRDLSLVSSSGGDVRPLVTRPGVDGDPSWSPDGEWIAFGSSGGALESVGLTDVWVVPASGGEPRRLGPTHDREANLIGWTANADAVIVTEAVGVDRHVLAVPLDGGGPRRITTGEGAYGEPSFDRASRRMAFAFEDTDTPVDVYVSDVADFEPRRLSTINAHLPLPALGRTELVRWTMDDGFEIEGLLTYPVDYEEGARVPLLLLVHGGPAGVFSRTFTGRAGIYMLQVFAENGYAVLRPNPRGSTGYGRDFRYANVQDWGFGDYRDLMAGVDHVITMGVAHPDSLVVAGWSYGGYMTSWIVTATDRFQAASMGAGLPNLISMVTTTDIPDYLAAHMGGEFWENIEVYERHSPIYQIADVETPTQILHGAEDERVPTAQGREFYVALKRLGVPTEMVIYPRTPHGPREPKLLMDVTPRILDWFARWLRAEQPPRVTTP